MGNKKVVIRLHGDPHPKLANACIRSVIAFRFHLTNCAPNSCWRGHTESANGKITNLVVFIVTIINRGDV
jgi:hypothetical protein